MLFDSYGYYILTFSVCCLMFMERVKVLKVFCVLIPMFSIQGYTYVNLLFKKVLLQCLYLL